MEELIIFGPVFGPTGYDEVTRRFLKSLFLKGVRIFLIPNLRWTIYKTLLSKELINIMNICINTKMIGNKIVPKLSFCLPEQVELKESYFNINFTMFEANKICSNWVNISNIMDQIFLPNDFAIQTWINSGVHSELIKKVPIGIDLDDLKVNYSVVSNNNLYKNLELIKKKYPIKILIAGENTLRKNIVNAVYWFYRIFSSFDSVCLIIKTGSYSFSDKNILDEIVLLRNYMKLQKYPKIFICDSIISKDMMNIFYDVADVYLSMSKGEGFDLNCLHMAALGKKVIVPKHTGYLEYLFETDNVLFLDVELEPSIVESGLSRLYSNGEWYKIPYLVDTKKILDFVFNRKPNKDLSKHIIKNYSMDTISDILISNINNLIF